MLTKLRNKNKGFTIIEVMIVLAIAGLIILIVLLAIPALQRNSRNTTIKNDASALAGGFSEFKSNNDGKLPSKITTTDTNVVIGDSTSSQANAKVSASTTVNDAEATPTSFKAGELWWNTGKTCDDTDNARAIAVYYYVETTGKPSDTPKCVDAS